MCTVSMIGDFYNEKWENWKPLIPGTNPYIPSIPYPFGPTKEEFDALRKDVLDMKELLKRAIKYDRDNGEPDCQMEDKIATLKKIAELVGVDLKDILKGG